jgi:ribosomal protein L16 Arg81 hydroxylase
LSDSEEREKYDNHIRFSSGSDFNSRFDFESILRKIDEARGLAKREITRMEKNIKESMELVEMIEKAIKSSAETERKCAEIMEASRVEGERRVAEILKEEEEKLRDLQKGEVIKNILL